MFDLPELVYEKGCQIIPDTDPPIALVSNIPMVMWHGRSVEIKDILYAFWQVDNDGCYSHGQKLIFKKKSWRLLKTSSNPIRFT